MLSKILSILEKFSHREEDDIHENLEKILKNSNIKLRPEQKKILLFLFQSSSKFKAVEAPTGSGKTLSYLIYAFSKNYPLTVISTFTKALQEQIFTESQRFFQITPHLLKGKSNYICPDKAELLLSEEEKKLIDQDFIPETIRNKISVTSHYCRPDYIRICPFKEKCTYLKAKEKALSERVVVVNHFLLPFLIRNLADRKFLLIIDECHTLERITRKITFTEEDLIPPEVPLPENFSSLREYNLALENYYRRNEKFKLAQLLEITHPGTYDVNDNQMIDLGTAGEVLFFSGTLPETLPVSEEELDILHLTDRRDWSKVRITVKDINYRQPDYHRVLKKTIEHALRSYPKVLVLATSYQQLDFIKSNFPHAVTTKEMKAFHLAEKLISGEVKLAAGTDVFWTGIDVPGKKCIIMTKLPFPAPEENDREEKDFITGFQHMFRKLKQGVGRMLRTPECEGEIILLDNRVRKYPELVLYFEELEKKGAEVVFEKEHVVRTERKEVVLRVVK